jgi:pyruvate carboxylase
VAAPFAGVVTPSVAEGDAVEAGATGGDDRGDEDGGGDHRPGRRNRAAAGDRAVQQVEGGDLVLVITPAS